MSLEGLINVVALVLMTYLLDGGGQLNQSVIPSCWFSPAQLECWTFAATPAGSARHER
ncbi:hypothetical protein [Pseudomonas aeruginosa]|uniref:hypothetical protein n=1 Tax=Pseudomonas aeruginosa TaxID=287 RepID=UPI0013BE9171|nr:hypothetical protein [Pseudomonas aeruginosa]MCM4073115.1 hypothetical protein [Pseudomonas aeruginosa]MCM4091973.1 hypothetical protein [Pseudomonas aeruginosa]MCM4105684.1 hypothetical protein [Pseudomonas aeruginosa]MCM4118621.1 hypothetical protein [Pseudomonas aeruginosa]MCV0154964.1 hypothetical protein [Pseudomonas aeruginosa]